MKFVGATRVWIASAQIGAGGQGVVYQVHDEADPDRRPHALKTLRQRDDVRGERSPEKQLRRFRSEAGALRALNGAGCPGIVAVLDAELSAINGPPWFVMPLYAAGPMYSRKRVPQFIERYTGDINRVLTICRELARTLAFMHETSPGWVHRDVKSANVFFESLGSAPILGDFGLVASAEVDYAGPTAVPEAVGPGAWRPPELRRGGVEKRHPGSDVYLLGGLIYEMLTGGDMIDEIEHPGRYYAHELPELSIARYTRDQRASFVNDLLRGMFRRDPDLRIGATTVLQICDEVVGWREGGKAPLVAPHMSEAEEAAAEYKSRSAAIRDEGVRQELAATCERVARHFGQRQWAAVNEITTMIDVNSGEARTGAIQAQHPDSVWMAVRVLVAFETHAARPLFMSYVCLARISPDKEMVGVVDDTGTWRQVAVGPPNSPGLHDALVREASAERDRLLAKLAPEIRALR